MDGRALGEGAGRGGGWGRGRGGAGGAFSLDRRRGSATPSPGWGRERAGGGAGARGAGWWGGVSILSLRVCACGPFCGKWGVCARSHERAKARETPVCLPVCA